MIKYKYILIILAILVNSLSFAQTRAERNIITKDYDKVKLAEIAEEYRIIQENEKAEAIRLAHENNWPITFTDENGSFNELRKVSKDGTPQYYTTYNQNAARSSRAKWLHNGGGMGLNIEGQNMTAYVWDGGHAHDTHNEFSLAGVSRVTFGDSMDEDDPDDPEGRYHGTHVSGTIAARGVYVTTKGMAPEASLVSYVWTGDMSEVTAAAADGMLISNHSYGARFNDTPDWEIGAYTMESRYWDNIMYNAPYYLKVVAAGNEGDNNYGNANPMEGNTLYDKMIGDCVSKNPLIVAAGHDLSTNSNGDISGSPVIASFSSEGPTDDYRIKPDITGNGTSVVSCISSSNSSYATYDGTSMASPNVTGSLLLLQQLNNEENGSFLLSSTLKGLALHTADDGGLYGPDAKFGWGYMNTKAAAECILNDGTTSEVETYTMNNGNSFSFAVTADGVNPLLASICWTDLPSNNVAYNDTQANRTDAMLVNDLDIRITKAGTTYEPWKLTGLNSNTTGDNTVDNFERIDVIGASGDYVITVTHKGTLSSPQTFSLVITGITDFQNTTSIGEQAFASFKLWPNPSKGIFTLAVEDANTITVAITDVLGKVILSESYANQNNFTKQYNLTNLPSGVYMVSVQNENNKSTSKLIIE